MGKSKVSRQVLPAVVEQEYLEAMGMGLPQPDFSIIIGDPNLTLQQKRDKILKQIGAKIPKRKYKTKEERKAAAKLRQRERKAERDFILRAHGLGREAKEKLTKEQRAEARSARVKERRAFIKEMARADPERARKYGIDPSRFRD